MPAQTFPARLTANAALDRARPYGPAERALMSAEGLARAMAEITAWPGYAPTPLIDLPGLAAAAGVGRVLHKDEGRRFTLKSFKALGGAYAVLTVLQDRAEALGAGRPSAADLRAGRGPEALREVTVCCATDGNHGRSVAWGAEMFGCRCAIYLHEGVSLSREREIARFGAEIRRRPGDYDASIAACAREAEVEGMVVVADTSAGLADPTIPARVMQGYGVIASEIDDQVPAAPTHVFVPAAVGGLAAGLVATWWEGMGADRPVIVAVEPPQADCVSRSLAAGEMRTAPGPVESFMACLAAGEVSPAAWDLLAPSLDFALTIPDDAAAAAMRLLAEGVAGDPPVVAGESGAAATAGLLAAAADPQVRAALGLGPASVVVCIGSEGATDAETYTETVGRAAEAVA